MAKQRGWDLCGTSVYRISKGKELVKNKMDFFHAGRMATSAVCPEHKTGLWPAQDQRGPN